MTEFQVKPVNLEDVWCWNMATAWMQVGGFLFFLCQGKTTHPNDGRAKGDDRQWGGEIGAKDRDVSSFPSFSRTDATKTNEAGGSKSPECIHHIASLLTCGWRSVQLEETALPMNNREKNPKLWWSCCVGTGGRELKGRSWGGVGVRLGSDRKGKRRWHCFQSVCKNTCPSTAGTRTPLLLLLLFLFLFFTFTFSVCCTFSPF